ncbi:MAG: glucose 1-dehydrogenase [Deltaproteobacteria bacterium]|jgi:gluconate 5-dehydrogenase|nr:glucose 1-dehydrogenase [Deltaproteobacteria bacterium]
MLQGKTALVTGGSRGIGQAIAQALYDQGARVYITSRNQDELEKTAAGINAKGSGLALPLAFDVSNSTACRQAIQHIAVAGHGLNILVNCAGVNLRGPLESLPEEAWDTVFTINLKSMFILSQAAFPMLKGGGKIINIASLMSELARPNIAPYVASKGGVRQLTKAMAVEWAQHSIHVNAIAPGYIATEMNIPLMQDKTFNEFIINRTPVRRWGKPEDIAAAAVFLASPGADFITGQIIAVDGGILASL